MTNYPIQRVNAICCNGKMCSATLQQRVSVDFATGRETWKDVRPLTVAPDGEIVLGFIPEDDTRFNDVYDRCRVKLEDEASHDE